MTEKMSWLGFLFGVVGWVSVYFVVTNLLSGYLAERSCQTGCVQFLFVAACSLAVSAAVAGLLAVQSRRDSKLGWLSLGISVPLCGILGTIMVVGSLA